MRRHRSTESEPEAAHERLRSVYGPADVRLLADPVDFAFLLDLVEIDELAVGSVRYSGRACLDVPPRDALVVVGAHQPGCFTLEVDGERSGTTPLLAPARRRFTAWCDDLDATVVALDPAAVAHVGAELGGIAPERVAFTHSAAVSPDRARFWNACAAHVRRDVLDRDDLPAQPLVRDHVVRHLAIALLATFPNTALTADAPARREDGAPATVRRAVAFIDAHAHEPIGLTEIAAAAGLGPRGLQQAFAHHRDSTPLAHLRRVRLERAHRDLQAADPTTGDTVAAIAARWGFAHAGRFSLTYREEYGVSPSHTLRV